MSLLKYKTGSCGHIYRSLLTYLYVSLTAIVEGLQ